MGDAWLAENYLRQRRYSAPGPAILLLVSCMTPQEREEVVEDVARRTGRTVSAIQSLLVPLLREELLLTRTSNDVQRFQQIRRCWADSGWSEAAEYHLLTYDYAFLGADDDGRRESRQRMLDYSGLEPDLDRTKRYEAPQARLPLPSPLAEHVTASASEVWERQVPDRELEGNSLAALLSLAFAKMGPIGTQWNGAPLIHRSSPSGGARHPTEAYVAATNVRDLAPGWYHVAVDPPELELLRPLDAAELAQAFPATYERAPFQVAAIVVLTSRFERNMYRYREPRTFRTVHMDAGHLAATVQILAAAFGVRSHVQYAAEETAVERALDIHPLEEGFLLSIALGAAASGGGGRD
jgi:SagB-type dehydrogenase family enzyme